MLEKKETEDTCNVRSHATSSLIQGRNFSKGKINQEKEGGKKRSVLWLKYKTDRFYIIIITIYNTVRQMMSYDGIIQSR